MFNRRSSSLLLLLLTACGNPLSQDSSQSKFDVTHQPGLTEVPITPTIPLDPFTQAWTLNASTAASYLFDPNIIQVSGTGAKLLGSQQTDSSSTESTSGTLSAGIRSGVTYGALSEGVNQGLKLGSDGGCDGSASDCAKQSIPEIYELHSSWTPQWDRLKGYYKMNGSGSVHNADVLTATVGTNATATYATTGGLTYGIGKVGNSIQMTNTVGETINLNTQFFSSTDASKEFTTSFWINTTYNAASSGPIISQWTSDGKGFLVYLIGPHCCLANGAVILFVGSGEVLYGHKSVNDGNWHYISFTRSSAGGLTLYIDGVLDSTGTYAGLFGTATTKIGAAYASNISPSAKLDDLAIWDIKLSAVEIQDIYNHQKSAYSGTFTSRLMNAGIAVNWTSLSWTPTLPFYKELPDATCAPTPCTHNNLESATNYSSLVGSTGATTDTTISTAGLVGLWHLDEIAATSGAGNDFKDDSGNDNSAEAAGTVAFGQNGRFGKAPYFDGTSGYVSVAVSSRLDLKGNLSYSFWMQPTVIPASTTYPLCKAAAAGSTNKYFCLRLTSTGAVQGEIYESTAGTAVAVALSGTGLITAGSWYHIAYTYDGTNGRIYINGTLAATSSNYARSALPSDTTVPLTLGSRAGTTGFYNGVVDEVALWSRALHGNEVKQLYQRGASRIKYQIRSCATDPCTTESWKGPDGSSGTYFSELNNNSIPATGAGDVKATLPSMDWNTASAYFSAVNTLTQKYFQYRTILESDSSVATLKPELKSVSVGPGHSLSYLNSDTSPGNTIVAQTGIAFLELSDFVHTLGTNGCNNGIFYNLALSSTGPWKYWNGTAWAAANGSSGQANLLTDLSANSNAALVAFASQVGTGSVFFKAFMTSDGASQCELANIAISGKR